MPTLYRYLGYIILFHTHDHEPVHLHVQYNGCESIIELHYIDGELTLKERKVKKIAPLSEKDLKKVKSFIILKHKEIVESWKNHFIYKKVIKTQTITQVLKGKEK